MSTAHLRIQNPAFTLVLDSAAANYHFHSRPAANVAGAKSSSQVTPYQYVVNTGSDSAPPIAAVRPASDRLMEVAGVVGLGGGNWRIDVYGKSVTASLLSMADAAVAAPDVYVFVPTNAPSSSAAHLRMFSGGVCSFDSGFKPLWLRGSQGFGAASGLYFVAGGHTDRASWDSDSQNVTGYSALGVFGCPSGFSQATMDATGEPSDKWRYGWRLNGSSLQRLRYWIGTDKSGHSFDDTFDYADWERKATTALLLDLSTY